MQVVLERIFDSSGRRTGYRVVSKRYRRRKPEMRPSGLKWVDDKSASAAVEDPATPEDQRRVSLAWSIVQHWLRHLEPTQQEARPPYDAMDAGHYAMWGHFAQFVQHVLRTAPDEVAGLQAQLAAVRPGASALPCRSLRRTLDRACAPPPSCNNSFCTDSFLFATLAIARCGEIVAVACWTTSAER